MLAAVVAASTAALAARGGDEEKPTGNVERLLDRAFREPIERADLTLEAEVALDGLEGLERPIRLEAAGDYIGGGRALPQLDLDLTVGAQGAGQTVQFGLLRTADRAFLEFGGEFYEQPRDAVRRANRELGGQQGPRRGPLGRLGLDPRRWVVGAKDEGIELAGGVEARHVSGALDTHSLLGDYNRLVERSVGAIGGAGPDVPRPLLSEDIELFADVVGEPTFDVYVGRDDGAIRRLSVALEFRVPEEDRARVGGLRRGALRLSIELSDVNGGQQVKPPTSALPLADLIRQLGGLSVLEGVGLPEPDTAGGSPPAARAVPGAPAPGLPGPHPAAPDLPDSPAPDVDALGSYADCLDRAAPDETTALSRCRALLR